MPTNTFYRKQFFLLVLLAVLGTGPQRVLAQVSGLSYTLSPNASYNWWDDKSGLDNGLLVGANLGFGFGEFVELRGTYAQAINLQTQFADFGFEGLADTAFMMRDVDLTRFGGELKFNLSRGKLLPYLTLGTGIQEIQLDTFAENRVIYASAGLGLTLSAADRYTFTIEGKSTAYNFNAVRNLLTPEDRMMADLNPADFGNERLNNLSLQASLAFYLGGRRPGQLSDVDRAYQQAFGNGFKNLSILIEPTLSRVNFDDMLPFRDTWLGGANLGADFGPLVGFRGYYLQGMSDDEINLDFDDIAMYGGDFRFKLNNVASGLAPFVTVGGGYINVNDDYVARDTSSVNSRAFAAGGGGIVLGLGRNLQLRGSVKALLTSGENVEDLQTTDQITTSMQYSFGLNLALGKKAQSAEAIIASRTDAAVAAQNAVNAQETENLRKEYEAKVAQLQAELNEAYAKEDVEKAADLIEEVEQAEAVVTELRAREDAFAAEEQRARAERLAALATGPTVAAPPVVANSPYGAFGGGGRLVLTPAEFENLIDEILENMGASGQRLAPAIQPEVQRIAQMENSQRFQELETQLGNVERMLITLTERQKAATEAEGDRQTRAREDAKRDLTEFSARLLREMRKLQDDIDDLDRKVQRNARQGFNNAGDNRRDDSPAADYRNDGDGADRPARARRNRDQIAIGREPGYLAADTSGFSRIRYAGMSGFAGFNLGSDGNNTLNVGARWHYAFNKRGTELMPEAFFGFGSPSNFGLSANILQTFNVDKVGFIKPYVGAGFGFMQIGVEDEDKLRGAFNVILGTYLNLGGGRVYVDLTGRNLFKNNQLIAGYRFAF